MTSETKGAVLCKEHGWWHFGDCPDCECPACYAGVVSVIDDDGNEVEQVCDECDGTGKAPSSP